MTGGRRSRLTVASVSAVAGGGDSRTVELRAAADDAVLLVSLLGGYELSVARYFAPSVMNSVRACGDSLDAPSSFQFEFEIPEGAAVSVFSGHRRRAQLRH